MQCKRKTGCTFPSRNFIRYSGQTTNFETWTTRQPVRRFGLRGAKSALCEDTSVMGLNLSSLFVSACSLESWSVIVLSATPDFEYWLFRLCLFLWSLLHQIVVVLKIVDAGTVEKFIRQRFYSAKRGFSDYFSCIYIGEKWGLATVWTCGRIYQCDPL